MKSTLLLSTSVLMVLGASSIAAAQDSDIITVTSQKRAQNLQEVPLSVLVQDGEDLQKGVVTTLEDMTDGVPTVTVARTPLANSLYIRGVGSGSSPGFQQSVGTFVDGVYRGRGQAASTAFFDLERIEILRGPQPVYFGNSTVGGAFNIVTRGATDEFEASLITSYEFDADESVTEVAVSGPINDSLGFRVAYNHTESEGWLFDTIQNERTPKVNNDAVRATLEYDIADNLDTTLKVEFSDQLESGGYLQVVDCNATIFAAYEAAYLAQFPGGVLPPGAPPAAATSPNCNPSIFNVPGFEDNFDRNLSRGGVLPNGRPQDDFNDLRIWNGALSTNYELGDGHTVSFVTGYVDYVNFRLTDVDSGPGAFALSERGEDFWQWSQEVRLQSPDDQRLTYMLGAYYERSDLFYFNRANNGRLGPPTGPLFNGVQSWNRFFQNQRNFAIFGSATYEVIEDVNLKFGARWTDVETSVLKTQRTLTLDGDPGSPALIAAAAAPGPNPRDQHEFDETRSDTDFTPSVELQWFATDDVMFYASYKQAFKSGGFDPNVQLESLTNPTPTDPNGGFEFDDEQATSWELGAKTQFFDNALTLNIDLFRTSFKDLQVNNFDSASGTFVTGNAGEARSQGVEVEALWRVMEGLSLNFSGTLLDAEFTDFAQAQCNNAQQTAFNLSGAMGQCFQQLAGTETPFSPDYSGSVGFDFTTPIMENLEFVFNGNMTFTDDFQWGQNPDPEEIQSGHVKVNLRAGVAGNDGQWELAFVGRNLTDELTFRFSGELPGAVGRFAFADRGREMGIQALFRF
ncbi:MAG: TonB-dependent receptor [Pseudomonadota bacterium]